MNGQPVSFSLMFACSDVERQRHEGITMVGARRVFGRECETPIAMMEECIAEFA
jgi:hypothetical protein